jgi:hypothetical protein
MPNRPCSYVKTERGYRWLHLDETARGLGLPKEWNWGRSPLSHGTLNQTPSLFVWEYLSETLSKTAPMEPTDDGPFLTAGTPRHNTPRSFRSPSVPYQEIPPFSWVPPDLTPGGAWRKHRLEHLRFAASTYPTSEELIKEGLRILEIHHKNYTSEGPDPKTLQLLLVVGLVPEGALGWASRGKHDEFP